MAASAVAALHIQRGPPYPPHLIGRGRDPRGGPSRSAGAPGMANVYEHVTPAMRAQVLDVLEQRFRASVHALSSREQERLMEMVPKLGEYYPVESEKKAS